MEIISFFMGSISFAASFPEFIETRRTVNSSSAQDFPRKFFFDTKLKSALLQSKFLQDKVMEGPVR